MALWHPTNPFPPGEAEIIVGSTELSFSDPPAGPRIQRKWPCVHVEAKRSRPPFSSPRVTFSHLHARIIISGRGVPLGQSHIEPTIRFPCRTWLSHYLFALRPDLPPCRLACLASRGMPHPSPRGRSRLKASPIARRGTSRTFVRPVAPLDERTQDVGHSVRQPGH